MGRTSKNHIPQQPEKTHWKMIVIILAGWLLAQFVVIPWFKEIKRPVAEGRVIVVTKGQDKINMAYVTVMALNVETLKKAIASCWAELNLRVPNMSESEWDAHRAKTILNKIGMDKVIQGAKGGSFKGKRVFTEFQETQTDSAGQFKFTLPTGGEYLFIAYGQRELGFGESENYFWATAFNLDNFNTYTFEIGNQHEMLAYRLPKTFESAFLATMSRYGLD